MPLTILPLLSSRRYVSPLMIRLCKLERSGANRSIKARTETQEGQNLWTVSVFSYRVWMNTLELESP